MANRRSFLQSVTTLPFLSGWFSGSKLSAAPAAREYFKELGVKPFINAAGTYTVLTASLMQPEVVQAMEYASRLFVRLGDVQDAVGKRIASLLGADAAMVTSGAAGAMTIATAGCITGKNQQLIQRIPDLTGMKSEVLIQKSHRYGYDHAVRSCGVKLVEIETAEELSRAVNEKSAMMLFYNNNDPVGRIRAQEWVDLGKKHQVPTFNDASADVPPVENLTKYFKMGFDLVTFSGGKGLCGPQSAGILAGRRDLIEAARMNTSPNSDTVSRGMKVNKEEMLGMLVALERYMQRDHAAEWREWERRVKVIADSVSRIASVTTSVDIPEIANHVPHLQIRWDRERVKITPPEVMKQLRNGDPSIEACPLTNREQLVIAVWMLQPGEAEIVARQVRAILQSAA
jgi:L-seryl-tRNA(Ser) seleniumtransferase